MQPNDYGFLPRKDLTTLINTSSERNKHFAQRVLFFSRNCVFIPEGESQGVYDPDYDYPDVESEYNFSNVLRTTAT